tara:strand:- start:6 stop:548 length:543 start_codon:yes stop_codon:yes gene_type:complete
LKQLKLKGFEIKREINPEDHVDLSEGALFFGDVGQRVKDLNRTSEFLASLPKGRYIAYKTGATHRLPAYKGREDFPYILDTYSDRIISTSFSRSVYPCFTLIQNKGQQMTVYAHRIFAMAFVKNNTPTLQYTVDHMNEDKLDYAIHNLMWVSAAENQTNIKNTALKRGGSIKVYSSDNYI